MLGKRVLVAAILAYLLAWLLPTVVVTIDRLTGPTTVVIRGWEATRWALSPLWPDGRSITAGRFRLAVLVASGLSNLLFVGAVVLAARWAERVTRWLVVTVWVAVLVNAQWLLFFGPDWRHLRAGYYLWLSSFVLLAVALGQIHRARPAGSIPKPAA